MYDFARFPVALAASPSPPPGRATLKVKVRTQEATNHGDMHVPGT